MSISRVFIAATRQNDGKTMTSLGLFQAFKKRFDSVGYMKPVGQHYINIDNQKIDKDAVLFQKVYDLPDKLPLMSPVAVPRGFTESYIDHPKKTDIHEKITKSFHHLSKGKTFMLIEGTGHAGVGSVFDTSNATVAKKLKSKVILVSPGGIGRAIDEIILNKASFDMAKTEIIGVIINKVKEEKYDKIVKYATQGLKRFDVPVLGAIPYVRMLSSPSIEELKDQLNATLISGMCNIKNKAEKVLIGAMASYDALDYFEKNTVLIVPGNREGVIMTALFTSLLPKKVNFNVSGIIFTGGIKPHPKIMDLIKHTNIPLLLVNNDSYSVAVKVNNMLVKLRSHEDDKIVKIQSLIEEYVDVDRICSLL